jgi:hypothetical protein
MDMTIHMDTVTTIRMDIVMIMIIAMTTAHILTLIGDQTYTLGPLHKAS